MMVRVPDIPTEGLGVTGAAALGTVYRDPSWRLEDVQLRIERDGLDVFVTGELRATVTQTCGRCLEPVAATAAAAINVRLVPRPASGDTRRELDATAETTPLKDAWAEAPHALQAGDTDTLGVPAVPRKQAPASRVPALWLLQGRGDRRRRGGVVDPDPPAMKMANAD